MEMVLFLADSQFCGAIMTNIGELTDRAFDIVEFDQDDLLSVSLDLKYVFYFDWFTGENGVESFDVFVWGDEWVEAISK